MQIYLRSLTLSSFLLINATTIDLNAATTATARPPATPTPVAGALGTTLHKSSSIASSPAGAAAKPTTTASPTTLFTNPLTGTAGTPASSTTDLADIPPVSPKTSEQIAKEIKELKKKLSEAETLLGQTQQHEASEKLKEIYADENDAKERLKEAKELQAQAEADIALAKKEESAAKTGLNTGNSEEVSTPENQTSSEEEGKKSSSKISALPATQKNTNGKNIKSDDQISKSTPTKDIAVKNTAHPTEPNVSKTADKKTAAPAKNHVSTSDNE